METLALRTGTDLQAPDSLDTLVDRFLSSQDVRQSSKSTYKRTLGQFTAWIVAGGDSSLDREKILAYKRNLEEKGLSPLTISAYLVAVRRFFEWAETVKLYPNVARGIKGTKRARGFRKDPLTIAQIKELLSSIPLSSIEDRRDYALINLLVRTGLRAVETVRANIEDVRQEGGEAVLWIQGKGRDAKDEFVLLTPDTLKPINDYLHARGTVDAQAPLFVSHSDRNKHKRLTTRTISRIVKTRLCGIGLNSGRLTAHSLRHTAITLSLQAGATIQEAQALGRHADINTTLIYAHNINRVANAPERKIEELLKAC